MKKSKLINFTTQDFIPEKELEPQLYRWDNVKGKYIQKLRAIGLLRVITKKFGIIKRAFAGRDIYLNTKMNKHIKSVTQLLRKLREKSRKIS